MQIRKGLMSMEKAGNNGFKGEEIIILKGKVECSLKDGNQNIGYCKLWFAEKEKCTLSFSSWTKMNELSVRAATLLVVSP